uniref:Small ribosomal subunit protein uS8c n=1 Tax=Pteridium aquilinum subsp. aquilinum TaxID=104588 RepID=E2IH47_PTEAA|nr:ribosomal protein S8 [Pteridium aquilinum subsp. aquilinum]ADK47592.1 ribosomal protein S8 [Pteridium aquilinum subsp. aquilinum]
MNNDAISTAVTAIRNANTRRKAMIRIPATKMTKSIVQISLEEGFIRSVAEHKESRKEFLDVSLKYFGKKKEPHIVAIKCISKPGLRIYSDSREIPKILGGMGIAIPPTSYGLVTDREARQKKIGGEVVCHIW